MVDPEKKQDEALTLDDAEDFLVDALKYANAMVHKIGEAIQVVRAVRSSQEEIEKRVDGDQKKQ